MRTTGPSRAGAAGPDGLGWAPPGPAAPAQLIERIVQAVRADDGAAIPGLLHQLADVADTEALLLLRRKLDDDLHR